MASSDPSSSSSSTAQTNEVELQARAEVFRRLHPRAYLERFLAEGVRPDARAPLDFRDVSINAGASVTFADCFGPPDGWPRTFRFDLNGRWLSAGSTG